MAPIKQPKPQPTKKYGSPSLHEMAPERLAQHYERQRARSSRVSSLYRGETVRDEIVQQAGEEMEERDGYVDSNEDGQDADQMVQEEYRESGRRFPASMAEDNLNTHIAASSEIPVTKNKDKGKQTAEPEESEHSSDEYLDHDDTEDDDEYEDDEYKPNTNTIAKAKSSAEMRTACDRCAYKAIRCDKQNGGEVCDRCEDVGAKCVYGARGTPKRRPSR